MDKNLQDTLAIIRDYVKQLQNKKNVQETKHKEELGVKPKKERSPDMLYMMKCFKYLKKIGYVRSQYDFSEKILHKNKYYFGMIISEERQPSLDALHKLVKHLSEMKDDTHRSLLQLTEEGHNILTKRLLKYF